VVFGGVADRGNDVVGIARTHNSHRPQLIDARVGGVQLSENVIAADIALYEPAQVFFNSLLVWVHGFDFGLRISDFGLGLSNPQSAI